MNTSNSNFGFEKKEKQSIKDFINPTKQYAAEVKVISDKIKQETDSMILDLKVFQDAFNEIKDKHKEGMKMQEISDSYKKEKEQAEIKGIEDDILDIFSKKLKSLKQSLKISSEEDFM